MMAEFEDGGAEGLRALEEQGLGSDRGVAGEKGGVAVTLESEDERGEIIAPRECLRRELVQGWRRGKRFGVQRAEIRAETRVDDVPWDAAVGGEVLESAYEKVARWRGRGEDRADAHSFDYLWEAADVIAVEVRYENRVEAVDAHGAQVRDDDAGAC